MKLEVGMYVRTKYGITQYREYEINNCGLLSKIICMPVKCCNEGIFANAEDIVKASHNIIDLIEVGDFVDYEYPTGLGMWYCKNVEITEHLLNVFKNGENNHEYKITSIVTKEQFEDMIYKVGE